MKAVKKKTCAECNRVKYDLCVLFARFAMEWDGKGDRELVWEKILHWDSANGWTPFMHTNKRAIDCLRMMCTARRRQTKKCTNFRNNCPEPATTWVRDNRTEKKHQHFADDGNRFWLRRCRWKTTKNYIRIFLGRPRKSVLSFFFFFFFLPQKKCARIAKNHCVDYHFDREQSMECYLALQ